ncbi:phosphoribosylformylglycinamidine synthase subunit PurQ [Bacillus salipaludis]|uniref:Phosphoribosylformylglycinamidine synthase subunit PurQ n=1 Tax=Bacillus salipaludis TaxID=2547811 RepID=A0A4R5VT29_9BACI|nr:phosphoribosylformylglycinamidine synthase subunit PurQ [Bacillus salipaludis]MDQ6598430.1 phosphoribosylformylglycinamidine synthase subunit PurQ [Bacillus salipaludis]TDK61010.1 phosphoribosylformylglycinamidine synthase subunit PurQ [Bacillus salipaludis]
MNFAVLVFPGSNCDVDMYKAVVDTIEQPVEYVWHLETDLSKYDGILVPGGFSYGDYLRPGAVASLSPAMEQVKIAAESGKLVLGVCNGFQILTEAGLLPGALRRNQRLKFHCETINLIVENNQTPFTLEYEEGEKIRIPIAHGDGNYYCNEDTLNELEKNKQIVFRYEGKNPNGSVSEIAGIINQRGNVLGLMPHPERAVHKWLGSDDGKRMFSSILSYWRKQNGTA